MPGTKCLVKLLCCTPSPEEIVAMSAKMCYSAAGVEEIAEGVASKDQSKYLERLIEMGHLSPIEHASFTFGVEGVSRALLAQVTRHRLASFSVQSQRYVNQSKKGFHYIIPPAIEAMGDAAVSEFESQMAQMQQWYDEWVKKLGDCGESSNEDARFVLPNAAETKFVVTMNARELLHFFSLRCCGRAQWEIREMAWQMLKLAREAAPHLFAQAGPGCVRGACPEGKMCCGRMQEMRARHEQLLQEQ